MKSCSHKNLADGSTSIPVFRIIWFQLIGTLVAAALSLLLGLVSAYSALLGGLVCVVPNAFLAARFIGALKIERSRVFKRLIVSEVLKLVITGVFFALVFIYVDPLNTLIFFASFIGVQAIHWLSPLILKTG